MAKQHTFKNKFAIVDALREVDAGVRRTEAPRSYHLMRQLVAMGYLDYETVPAETKRRGRKQKVFSVSGKGRGYLALARNWKRSA